MQRDGEDRAPRVLVVDDTAANRHLLKVYLSALDCEVLTAEDGLTALRLVSEAAPDLVLLDVQMPGLDGFEVCRRIKSAPVTRLLPVVMVTALHDTSDRVRALEAGADDFLSKPVERVELVARARSALNIKAAYDKLDSAERVIFALAAAVEAKDAHTEAHTERVARTAHRLAGKLGLPPAERQAAYLAGKVHDIGKIGVPDSILSKPGALADTEWAVMRRHPIVGENIVRPLHSADQIRPVVRHHHEAWNGSGYPDGLRGNEIPLLARLVAVCDAYDSLTSDRPYRAGRTVEDAITILIEGRGRQWDAQLVDMLVADIAGDGSD